jgi:hypothetical protein
MHRKPGAGKSQAHPSEVDEKMSSAALARVLGTEENEILTESRTVKPTKEPAGLIERLKEEFGDYSDPLTYDWTWRETD